MFENLEKKSSEKKTSLNLKGETKLTPNSLLILKTEFNKIEFKSFEF